VNIIEDGRLAGPQIRIAEVARELGRYDIATTVVFPKHQSEVFKSKLDQYKVNAVRLPIHRLTRNKIDLLKYLLFLIYEIILLYSFLKKEHFDIIHCSGGSWQYKGLIAGKMAGIKTLWHLNDTGMPSVILFLFRNVAARFADGFIVAGQRVKDFYSAHLGSTAKPIIEIQAPVATANFDPQHIEPDSTVDAKPGVKIISIGNLNPLKGYEYFIQMADRLNQSHQNLHFFIVGPDFESQKNYVGQLHYLKQKFKLNNLKFYGACHDVRKVLKAADIYVCSSITEASPVSVWEAMSMGKAIVATDVGDVARFLTHEKNGFIVPIKDPESLAEKVDILIRNPERRKEFGEKAMNVARQKLDVQIIARHHRDAYYSILKLQP
jgi:glycosyltransferase involved in cell wall biosynthesis